jgi:hypothetical protein
MLTLSFAPGPSSMAPHIALHEIGAPSESRPLSLRTGVVAFTATMGKRLRAAAIASPSLV